ncbi:MAG TPA: RagB/SusD family nutrient uptake outer membrane protein [Niabella sp.]|nr:RagB/SusD family nutrient uptake outer membrane protein [Niabella sp.]
MKNIKSSIILFTLVATLSGISSCKRDILDVMPTDILTSEAIFQDSVLTEAYVLGRYVRAGGPFTFGRPLSQVWLGSITDESIATYDNGSFSLVKGIISPENSSFMANLWGENYRGIRECNIALQNLDKAPMSDARKEWFKAEIRFIRAYRYHDLIVNYGGVPIMGDRVYMLSDTDLDSLYDRKPVQECISYTVNELNTAAVGLEKSSKVFNIAWGRATKEAAMTLKSRLLLYAASPLYNEGKNGTATQWAAAAAAAKEVMDLKKFSLYTGGFAKLFLTEKTPEAIYERTFTTTSTHISMERQNGPNGFGGWAGNTPTQLLVDEFELIGPSDGVLPVLGYSDAEHMKPIINPDAVALGYNDKTNLYARRDPRFGEMILYNGIVHRGRPIETFLPGGLDSKDGNEPWNTSKTGYYPNKFLDPAKPVTSPPSTAGTQPWKYMRYAEVLLNYAEAQNEAVGPDATVYSAINQVRARAGMPDIPAGLSQSEMRIRIRHERRIELLWEEHRFYDVRRWMIAPQTESLPVQGILPTKSGGVVTYERIKVFDRLWKDDYYWMPIPLADIQASNGKLKQNPGY